MHDKDEVRRIDNGLAKGAMNNIGRDSGNQLLAPASSYKQNSKG
jgi:hypothetical protein